VHLDGQGVAGLDATATCDGTAVLVATDIIAHHILNRGVGQRQAHASLTVLGSLAFELITSHHEKTYLISAIDPQVLERSMASNLLRSKSRDKGEDSRLHGRV